MTLTHGTVLDVNEKIVGAHLSADAASSATTLFLDDLSCYSETGGTVTITDADNTEGATYLSLDFDAGTMALSAGTVNAYGAGAAVQLSPEQKSRYAAVQFDDPETPPVIARVPFALYSLIALGIRSDIVGADESSSEIGEEVTLELQRGVWVLTDVLRQVPVLDPSILPGADVQIFTTPGSFTWNKPDGFKMAHIVVIGGGGGGASGRLNTTATNRSGGGGGGGAQLVIMDIPITLLGASESVTVGAGGTGAAGNSGATGTLSAGSAGNVGGNSAFGSWATALGGNAGLAGTATGVGGSPTGFGAGQYSLGGRGAGGGDGGVGSSGTAPTAGASTPNVVDGSSGAAGAAGGGGGGGMDSSNNTASGAAGGRAWGLVGGTAGTAPAGIGVGGGTSATMGNPVAGGGGGGGGSGNNNNVGGAGGNGGNYGGGGGGGGGSSTATGSNTGGAGGDGAGGIVSIICL